MKQTSLFQTWKTAPGPSSSTTRHNSTSTKSNAWSSPGLPVDLDDDGLLAQALDQFDAQYTTDDPVQLDQLIARLSKRPPINYVPTANDSSQLLEGFDADEGSNWIYPTNVSFRDYQFSIAEQCLYKNTLVCLPTGLGKTLIASVVIYNFMRWYPSGLVIFMAPTRPLVAQQLAACSHLLPSGCRVIELTGSIDKVKRQRLWNTYQAFFLTPQVLVNDLQTGACPGVNVRLLVFDEAHRAMGNYAYCQIIRLLADAPYLHRHFRVIGLSATPGSDIQGVQTLIANLLISHLELRTEDSPDVSPFTQHRQLQTVVVPLGPTLSNIRSQLLSCLTVPVGRLQRINLLPFVQLPSGLDRLAKFAVVKAREQWSSSDGRRNLLSVDVGAIHCDFALSICLLHAIELLEQHGLHPVYRYLSGVLQGQRSGPSLRGELARLPAWSSLWHDLVEQQQYQSSIGGHPKLDKLKALLVDHFGQSSHCDTRVIVFSQFRDSVDEIMQMLVDGNSNNIRPVSFTGQSTTGCSSRTTPQLQTSPTIASPTTTIAGGNSSTKGTSQREQVRIMNEFRSGTYNVLIATCVGEEGIDVGQVDLIVCFDAYKSPIRLMQRLGRTGRRRAGRIVMLLSEGREQNNHAVSVARSSSINKALLDGSAYRRLVFYPHNPRMIPLGVEPKFKLCSLTEGESNSTGPSSTRPVDESVDKRRTSKGSKRSITRPSFEVEIPELKPDRLLTISEAINEDDETMTVTRLFKVSSYRRLAVFRERLLGQQSSGSSTSSRDLIALLRLTELNRRGLTRLSFHAVGLRSIDVDSPFKELIGSDASQPTQKQQPINQLIDEKISSPKIDHSSDAILPSTTLTPTIYKDPIVSTPSLLTRGIVSNHIFFKPVYDIHILAKPMACRLEFTDRSEITTQSLLKQWQRLLDKFNDAPIDRSPCQSNATSVDQNTSYANSRSPTSNNIIPVAECQSQGNVIKINHDVDKVVVCVSSPVPASGAFRSIPNSVSIDQTRVNSPVVQSDSSMGNNAACFLSSPIAPASNNLITAFKNLTNKSQVNLSEALRLLDQSSIQLNASSLIDDLPPPPPGQIDNTTLLEVIDPTPSVLPPTTPSSIQLGPFNTRLSLGGDLADWLAPTQQPLTGMCDKTLECYSQQTTQDVRFDTQAISWSPILVNDDDTELPTLPPTREEQQQGDDRVNRLTSTPHMSPDHNHCEKDVFSTFDDEVLLNIDLSKIDQPRVSSGKAIIGDKADGDKLKPHAGNRDQHDVFSTFDEFPSFEICEKGRLTRINNSASSSLTTASRIVDDQRNRPTSTPHVSPDHHQDNVFSTFDEFSIAKDPFNARIKPAKRRRLRNSIFLTQADRSDVSSSDSGESQSSSNDSFINDNATYNDSTGGNETLKEKSMTSVYLKSLHQKGFHQSVRTNQRESHKHPSFIYSQQPQPDDDYQLDSFCVGDDEASEPSSPPRKRRRKRKIIIESDSSDP